MVRKRSSSKYLSPDKYLNAEQIGRLLKAVKTEADRARHRGTARGAVNEMLVLLLLESGLRAEEVTRLQIRDLPHYHGKPVLLVRRGKGDILRTIDVKQSFAKRLHDFVKQYRKGAKPASPLFASEAGYRIIKTRVWRKGKPIVRKEYTARLSYQSLYQRIKRLGQTAMIPYLHPHMMRHTFAVQLYQIQRDLLTVQFELGHSKPETTARYAQVIDRSRQAQIEKLYR